MLLFILVVHTARVDRPCPIQDCLCYPASSEPTMRILDCRNISKISLLPHALTTNELFYEITFRNANLTVISDGDLLGLRTERLDLGNNKIRSIHTRAFSGLKFDLIYIHMKGDGETRVPFRSLRSLKSLRTLILENFLLQYLDSSVPFHLFPKLMHLSLINMNITFFSSCAFDNNAFKITEFHFCNNPKVSTFPVGAIKNLYYARKLIWTGNKMKIIPSHAFRDLSSLKYLDISNNEIFFLEVNSFSGVTEHLQGLNLSKNKLTTISVMQEFSRTLWKTLVYLSLSHNHIHHIDEGFLSNMVNLEHLDLSSNHLTTISESDFEHLENLQTLDLSQNAIHTVGIKAFMWTRSLTVLDLQNQATDRNSLEFTGVHDYSTQLHIQKLYLSHTKLTDSNFWQLLQALPFLRHLHADDTGLSMLMSGGFRSTNLSHISLQNNRFYEVFPGSFVGLDKSLESLNLRNNHLYTLDECVFKDLKSLKIIDVSRNHIDCSCTMYWLFDWLKSGSGRNLVYNHVADRQHLKCSSPQQYRNVNFQTAMKNLTCERRTSIICASSKTTSLAAKWNPLSYRWTFIAVMLILACIPSFILVFIIHILVSILKSVSSEKWQRTKTEATAAV